MNEAVCLHMIVLFAASGESKLVLCEGRTGKIACPGGKLIQISYANFGRLGKDLCKHRLMRATNCKAAR